MGVNWLVIGLFLPLSPPPPPLLANARIAIAVNTKQIADLRAKVLYKWGVGI
jgi:hypothetical protein